MRFKVVLIPSEESVAALVPALPGCNTQGATEAEALENAAVAIQEWIEAGEDRLDQDLKDEPNAREAWIEVESCHASPA